MGGVHPLLRAQLPIKLAEVVEKGKTLNDL